MSAAEIERLTDVIVEFTPGDRELAGRIAIGIWPYIERRERFAVHEFHKEPTEFTFVRLTDADDDGGTQGRSDAAGPLTGRTGGADEAMRGNGDGTSEGEVG